MKKIMIIGGGIGGLCTAIALQQYGFGVSVYERMRKLGEVGAGLTLWLNAIKVLRKLGVADAVISAGSKLKRSQIRANTGETLFDARADEMETKYGEPAVAIHRADLHKILINALKPGTLYLNMNCAKFEQDDEKVTVYFENGESDTADLLIGADGIHSVVRKQMFPEIQLRYSGYTAWRGVVETENEAALGLTSESWGMGARFGIVRVNKKRIYWFATHNQPIGEEATSEQKKSKLLGIFNKWHKPIVHLLDTTPAESILQNDICDIAPFTSWTKGRVTLLGDAAHPTSPNMGQGACMAIESAYVLARALAEEPDHKSALKRYENERYERTAWITNTSWLIGKGGQVENPLLIGLRNFIVKIAPTGAIQRNLHQAAGFDVTKTK
jgi:2-polyprenyl-6-methoxyphenol hydroxylase-like FAD-dependent oxidoreductase